MAETKAELKPESKDSDPIVVTKAQWVRDDRAVHPCPNCSKSCKGKQCYECHKKMFGLGECESCGKLCPQTFKYCRDCYEDHGDAQPRHCLYCSEIINFPFTFCKYHFLEDKAISEGEEYHKCYTATCPSFSYTKFCRGCWEAHSKYLISKRGSERV